MSVFDILSTKNYINDSREYYEEDEDTISKLKTSKTNAWIYSLITAIIITFLFSSFFLTQVDRILGESKFSQMMFKEDGEPKLLLNIIQLLIVFIIIKIISKW